MTAPPIEGAPARRRHTLADLYHERTNFQFIARSRRWLVISSALMLISVLALSVWRLNLGIEFEGGTAWQATAAKGGPSVPDVRDVLRPLGLADAKVTIIGGDTVRVQAEVLEDPVREISRALAEVGGVDAADVLLERFQGGGGRFRLTADGEPKQAEVEKALEEAGQPATRVKVDGKDVAVRYDKLPPSPVDEVTAALADYAGVEAADVSVSTVGPTWGEQVSRKALQALLIFFVLLAVYLSLRFEWKMAAAAIAAVMHDVVFTVGFYAVFRFEVSPATVTAFLTILGFSLYDTVVVFDKVAENQGSLLAVGRSTYAEMVNRSLNQVLMRSLSTSLLAVLPVISLLVIGSLVLGAVALEEFAIALLVGLFIGSYSSIFVAAPLLAWWKEKEPQYRALAERRRRATAATAGEAVFAATETEVLVGPAAAAAARGRSEGVPGGPPAVGRTAPPRPRQQRRRKRR